MSTVIIILVTVVITAWVTTEINTWVIGLGNKALMKEGKMYIKIDGVWFPRNPHRDAA